MDDSKHEHNESDSIAVTQPIASSQVDQTSMDGVSKTEPSATAISSIAEAELEGFHRVDPAVIKVERIGGWIFWLVLTVFGCIGLLLAWLAGMPNVGLFIFILTLATLSGLIAWAAHTFPAWEYAATGWRLDDKGFSVRTGIFWRKVICVPRARVQHADVHQGPLMRSYHIANIIVNTAGTENAKVELKG